MEVSWEIGLGLAMLKVVHQGEGCRRFLSITPRGRGETVFLPVGAFWELSPPGLHLRDPLLRAAQANQQVPLKPGSPPHSGCAEQAPETLQSSQDVPCSCTLAAPLLPPSPHLR